MFVPIAVLISATALCVSSKSSIPQWNIKLAQKQGPNVCIVEEVPSTKHKVWTDCKYWNPREICGQKPILKYECCEGYKRVPNTLGCIGVKPLKNVLETARDLGARKFVKYIQESGLEYELTRSGALTLFAPSDDAMESLTAERKKELERYLGTVQNPMVMYHIVDERLTSHHFKADTLVQTKYPGHELRINKFSSKIETVNCANLVSKDNEATNGVVHIIDSILDPTTSSRRNVADILVQDGRFSQFARIMEQSGISSSIRRSELHISILAPSDEAFQKLPKAVLSRILGGNYAREALIKNHIIPHTLCLPAILGHHKLRTESDEKIVMDCDKKGVTIKEKRLAPQFTLGRNGVIYMLNDVLLPDKVKSVVELAEEQGLDTFVSLIKAAKLENTFDDYGDYTLFVPSESSMQALPAERLQELRQNKEEAKKFVLHHCTEGRIRTNNMGNDEVVMSMDEVYPLRMHMDRKSQSVDGAMLEIPDKEGINGVVHVINKPLIPITKSWKDLVQNNESISTFLEIVDKLTANPEKIDMEDYKTVFIPTNDAFKSIHSSHFSRMKTDEVYMKKLIRNHVANTMIMTEPIIPGLQYSMETEDSEITIVKEKNGKLKVNEALMIECDLMSKTGVVHIIDKVLLPDGDVEIAH